MLEISVKVTYIFIYNEKVSNYASCINKPQNLLLRNCYNIKSQTDEKEEKIKAMICLTIF